MNLTHIKTLAVSNMLGEGVQWHKETSSVWWTDIHGACLYQYQIAQDQLTKYDLPERLGCFAFLQQQKQQELVIIAAFASGIASYNLQTETINWLAQPEKHNKGNRFNDGRADRLGNFWAGTLVENAESSTELAKLYCLNSTGISAQLTDIQISNALCFSIDNNWLYHADSPTGKIVKYPLSHNKQANQLSISGKGELFAQAADGISPDGACIDAEGALWSAQWGGGQVVRYLANGELDHIITMPVSQPTCAAIGGENMDLLFITSAKEGLSEQQLKQQPQAGHLFIYQLERPLGVDESKVCLAKFE